MARCNRVGHSVLIFLCLLVSLLVFCRGFLLTKVIIAGHRTVPPPVPRMTRKVVVIVIDALRPDFVFPNRVASLGGDDPATSSGHQSVLEKRITYIRDKLETSGNAAGFLFVADPPTTTSQRLKAMMTGSLPTFVEAGRNFDSDEIQEDNLIYQLSAHQQSNAVLGDDTWLNLFPKKMWSLSSVFPSFDVFDLDTVDNGILSSLYSVLRDPHDFVVAHFLGVDHVGHRYGAFESEMNRKLSQMNDVLTNVSTILSEGAEDAVLVVMGDHGMTDGGDHGGGSETESVSFLYVEHFNNRKQQHRHHDDTSGRMVDQWTKVRVENGDRTYSSLRTKTQSVIPQLSQMDLLPTLSTLLHVPIPKCNLGRVIPEVLSLVHQGTAATLEDVILKAVRSNAEQVHEYFREYVVATPSLAQHDEMKKLETKYAEAVLADNRLTETSTTTTAFKVAQEYDQYLRHVVAFARHQWTQYDVEMMVLAITMSLTICLGSLQPFFGQSSNYAYVTYVSILLSGFCCFLDYSIGGWVFTAFGFIYSALKITTTVRMRWLSEKPTIVFVALLFIRSALQVSNSFIVRDDFLCHIIVLASFAYLAFRMHHLQYKYPWLIATAVCCRVMLAKVNFRTHGTHLMAAVPHTSVDTVVSYVTLLCVEVLGERFLVDTVSLPKSLPRACAVCIGVYWVYNDDVTHVVAVWSARGCLCCITTMLILTMTKRNRVNPRVLSNYVFIAVLYLSIILSAQKVAISFFSFAFVVVSLQRMITPETPVTHDTVVISSLLYHLSQLLFYSTGHQAVLNTLDWSAAFVGIGRFSWYGGITLVGFNTFASVVLTIVSIPMIFGQHHHWMAPTTSASSSASPTSHQQGMYVVVVFSIVAFFATVAVAVQRRHLMLFEIFCPKWCFAFIGALVAAASNVVLTVFS
eukprot:PhF_6_TR24813/c0_g1_i2/m.34157/K05288/PIGO; phosphatidylinositol glycan, class O